MTREDHTLLRKTVFVPRTRSMDQNRNLRQELSLGEWMERRSSRRQPVTTITAIPRLCPPSAVTHVVAQHDVAHIPSNCRTEKEKGRKEMSMMRTFIHAFAAPERIVVAAMGAGYNDLLLHHAPRLCPCLCANSIEKRLLSCLFIYL